MESSFVSLVVKPVGKPDALIGHVRFDERGWKTGRRFGVSARAHPRLYKLASLHRESTKVGQSLRWCTAALQGVHYGVQTSTD